MAPVRYRGTVAPRRAAAAAPATLSPFDVGGVMQALLELQKMHTAFMTTAAGIEQMIAQIKQGPPGPAGTSIEFGQMRDAVVAKMPVPELKPHHLPILAELVAKQMPVPALQAEHLKVVADLVVKKMPKIKGKRGKPGRDGASIAPEKVIEVLKDKKFGIEHVEGLRQTLSVLENFKRSGGVRGGGDTVVAGSGVTITNTVNGNKQISATASGSVYYTPTGTVNSVNTTFTVTAQPSSVIADGTIYFEGAGYTYLAGTITMSNPPSQYIRYTL